MKILVLGISGMLGNAMFRVLKEDTSLEVFGVSRSNVNHQFFNSEVNSSIYTGIDVTQQEALRQLFVKIRPEVVVNCIGLIKQLMQATDPLQAIPINALLPHQLASLCEVNSARLIHVSTDCVFSGKRGNYRESDLSDADDIYGKSKYLGEVSYPHTLTLRTSIIGHELESASNLSLLGWFLRQEGPVMGYRNAIFSGLPTVELSRIVRNIILPRPLLSGVYHVAAAPIAKYDLLKLIAEIYSKKITIIPDDNLVIDRSLNADLFNQETGYRPADWNELVQRMFEFQ